ncbi:MAG: hypothetical protein LC737_01155 [Chloroflexi bacterium]|nr:hypothetical protein [Chloroflexota bacterium]
MRWILASNYNIFLTQNPLNETRDPAFFLNLFAQQFGWLGLAAAVVGMGALLARDEKATTKDERDQRSSFDLRHASGIFLLLSFLPYLIFVLVYRVPDIEVFAIPAFLILAIALGVGAHALVQWSRGGRILVSLLLGLLLAWNFVPIFQSSFAQNDLSRKTDVRDYGRAILAQSFPPRSVLVGILGEITLVRYFQETEHLQPDLVTIAADRDAERLAAIERETQAGHAVFTTRPLNGLPDRYSLGAFGPLVRVWARPPMGDLPSDSTRLAGIRYRVDEVTRAGEQVRVRITWQPTMPIRDDLKISVRVLDGEAVVAQHDDWPVHNVYHTPFWRAGEAIADEYTLSAPAETNNVRVLLIVYRVESGAEVGRVELGAPR